MKFLILSFSLFFSILAFGQKPLKVGESYGKQINRKALKSATTPDSLAKMLKYNKALENIAVKGTVTSVCPKKGCWLTLKTDSGERFFVKIKDYDFSVPISLIGEDVILEGTAEQKMLTVKEAKHYAEDAGKSPEEIATINEPTKEIRFLASGIKVVK